MPATERPNFLVCLFDSLSTADSGLLETPSDLPALSRLSESSALFTRAYSPCPESGPARASLFTGLDPCVHGLWTNGVTLPENERTFPQRLAHAGYASCLVGRRQLAGVSRWTTEHVRPDEFAHVEWAHGPLHRSRQNAYLAWLKRTAPERYARLFATQADPDDTRLTERQRASVDALPDDLSFNGWIGERVCEWIGAHPPDRPFLAVAGFSVGTSLGTEPSRIHDGEAVDRAALTQADAALGRILDRLNASHRADDTVVVVVAGRGNRGSSNTPDDAMNERSIRVPLLIHRAGQERRIEKAPVSTMDVAPTLLELAGVPTGPRVQGRSLGGVLSGRDAPRGWAMSRLRAGSRTGERDWQTALCTSTLKLVLRHGRPQDATEATPSLFDLDADPLERHDLAALPAHAADLEHMIDLMIDARCALEDRTEPRIAEF